MMLLCRLGASLLLLQTASPEPQIDPAPAQLLGHRGGRAGAGEAVEHDVARGASPPHDALQHLLRLLSRVVRDRADVREVHPDVVRQTISLRWDVALHGSVRAKPHKIQQLASCGLVSRR